VIALPWHNLRSSWHREQDKFQPFDVNVFQTPGVLNNSIPVPIEPEKKAAVLVTIILLDTLRSSLAPCLSRSSTGMLAMAFAGHGQDPKSSTCGCQLSCRRNPI
jgi:hypothetical protein